MIKPLLPFNLCWILFLFTNTSHAVTLNLDSTAEGGDGAFTGELVESPHDAGSIA